MQRQHTPAHLLRSDLFASRRRGASAACGKGVLAEAGARGSLAEEPIQLLMLDAFCDCLLVTAASALQGSQSGESRCDDLCGGSAQPGSVAPQVGLLSGAPEPHLRQPRRHSPASKGVCVLRM